MHVENGAQVVNAITVLLSGVTVISPVTKIKASKQSQRLDLILSVWNLVELFYLKKSLLSPIHVEHGPQFVNATFLLLSAATFISPVTKIMCQNNLKNFVQYFPFQT